MTLLVAGVVLVGGLCLLDLLLTFGVLRRLREHSAELARLGGQAPDMAPYDPQVLVGRQVPELAGEVGRRLVGFFSADCDACHEHAPRFAAEAHRFHDAQAVIMGTDDGADAIAGHLPGMAVVRGDEAGRLARLAGIEAFPTFVIVDGGSIVRALTEPSGLAEPVPAA